MIITYPERKLSLRNSCILQVVVNKFYNIFRFKKDTKELKKLYKKQILELKTKFSESEEKRISANTRLNQKTTWNENIIEKLHNVMQTQRKEAIDILTSVDTRKCEREAEIDWPGCF